MKIAYILLVFIFLVNCEPKKSSSNDALALLLYSQKSSLSYSSLSPQLNCPPAKLPEGIFLANTIVSNITGVSGDYKDPKKAIDGICGEGEDAGSLGVYSLEATGTNSSVVLSWGGNVVLNSTGIDFIVFENPFRYSSGVSTKYFIEPLVVEVSRDNSKWCGWEIQYKGNNGDLNTFSSNQKDWTNFAGLTPVTYNMASNPYTNEQLFDGNLGGGDRFDLDQLSNIGENCDENESKSIKLNGFSYIKLTSASARTNPSTQKSYPINPDSFNGGSDIDGVIAKIVTRP